MGFNRTEWFFFLKDFLAQDHYKVASRYAVMAANSPVLATIYAGKEDGSAVTDRSSAGNSNGAIRFWTDSSVTSLDISILTANGEAIFLKGVTPSVHGIYINRQILTSQLVIPLLFNNNVETDTGFTVPGGILMQDILLSVETLDAGETIDIGLDGSTTNDPNGLIAAASIATAGYVHLGGTINGGSPDYFDGVVYGVLMANFINGAEGANTVGGVVKLSSLIPAAETDANITYTCSAGSDVFTGYAVLILTKLPL